MLIKNDYKSAYKYLWRASRESDSLISVISANSAAIAQREFLEQKSVNNNLTIKAQRRFISLVVLLLLFLLSVISLLYTWKQNEKERMALIIGTLEGQIIDLSDENKDYETKINDLRRGKAMARFSYLSELYEILYRNNNESNDQALRRVYLQIKSKVSDLGSDIKARKRFEDMLNEESDNIVNRFRSDFPNLPEETVRLASYIFAGFDNTTLSLVLGTSPSNTRSVKKRLKDRIALSSAIYRDEYLSYFPIKTEKGD